MSSSIEQRFWDHFDSWENWRDGGPNTHLLDSMNLEERTRTECELLRRLNDEPAHSWVPMALGHLKSQKAEFAIRKQLTKATGSFRVALAEALWSICGDEHAVKVIIKTLKRKRLLNWLFSWRTDKTLDLPRIHAAVALGHIDHPDSHIALEQATKDSNYYVSYNAKSALHTLRTGMFDPIAQMAEEGWQVTQDAEGNTTIRRPRNDATEPEATT
ncbi:hypothetical protein GC207_01870 [bacterium]|nr:hypothetical protein [bacterium]